jgi:hypothetical protein
MLDAFAYRCTDKRRMLEVSDTIGPENDATILRDVGRADVVVVGWGKPPEPLRWRGARVDSQLRKAGVMRY